MQVLELPVVQNSNANGGGEDEALQYKIDKNLIYSFIFHSISPLTYF
jgi:hypothetical protein